MREMENEQQLSFSLPNGFIFFLTGLGRAGVEREGSGREEMDLMPQ